MSQLSSKYSNLPDIETQPDVYESPDTPEESDAVDNGAVDKFKGSIINASETDFPDTQELDEELEKISLQKDLSRLSQNISEPDSIDKKEGTIIKQAEMNEKLMVMNELYYIPETAKIHILAKTVELDGCISALEKLVGSISRKANKANALAVFGETIKMLTSEQNKLEKSFEINDMAIQQNIEVVDSHVTDLAECKGIFTSVMTMDRLCMMQYDIEG
ncbi:9598_t:CDS:10 [Entrophospora sp. SA101]|nr:9598_t:CDS:10 [Entrophospora sp. SA101]